MLHVRTLPIEARPHKSGLFMAARCSRADQIERALTPLASQGANGRDLQCRSKVPLNAPESQLPEAGRLHGSGGARQL